MRVLFTIFSIISGAAMLASPLILLNILGGAAVAAALILLLVDYLVK